jgi:hypothetical protein
LILRVFAVGRFIRFVVFAAAAYRVRRFKYFAKSQAADSELYQGLRHVVCSGAKTQPFRIAANTCLHEQAALAAAAPDNAGSTPR